MTEEQNVHERCGEMLDIMQGDKSLTSWNLNLVTFSFFHFFLFHFFFHFFKVGSQLHI